MSGTAVVLLTETSDKTVRVFKDAVGNTLLALKQSGYDIPGLISAEKNAMSGGVGFEGIAETYVATVTTLGQMIKTDIWVDITGLNSQAQDLDIIGDDGTGVAWFAQLTAAKNGVIYKAWMSCLELPAGGDPNISLYEAVEATGVEDTLISALDETLLLNSQSDGTDWAAGDTFLLAAMPTADKYLYLVQGDGTGTNATYTAGRFHFEFWGWKT